MARYHGRKGFAYIIGDPTTNGPGVLIPSLNSWTIDMATDKVEVTAFGDANKTYVQGLKDITGSLAGFWDSADDSLFDAADSDDGVKLYLYPSSDAPSVYWYGPAWVDASIEVGVGDAVTISGEFAANGSWGRKP
jgi:hypothetical protein